MELPRRSANDVFLPDGAFRHRVESIRQISDARDLTIGIFYAFDRRTRMLPYWYADKRMAPCAVRMLGDVLHDAGMSNYRIVLQQWSPNVLPSRTLLHGRPLDILMVSSMQVHAEPAYALIQDAHTLGKNRPLIIAGGPKAIYEPTDFLELGSTPGVGADCVVTGEAYVLLDLLYAVLLQRRPEQTMLDAYERCRNDRALSQIPGLVYLDPSDSPDGPVAVNTGIQRLLRDLDELPMPDAAFRRLEPPHRRRTLSAKPVPAKHVWWHSPIASVISTQGCKFNCSFCPIPAVNQRTWRHKSPKRLVQEIGHIYENFGIRDYFGTDDNFFNDRQTVIDLMTAMSEAKVSDGRRLGRRVRFYTEATEFDVFKNADLLPLARKGGLRAIWFGIEDITAELINKGQTAGKTAKLFSLLHQNRIDPMVMMIHSDTQPLRSAPGDLTGLLNQARYLFEHGAVSYQCTYLGPAVGTRDFEPAAQARSIYRRVGHDPIPQAYTDGNHVVASQHARPWDQQMNVLRAYASFYNPLNMLRTIWNIRRHPAGMKRFIFQIVGQIGLMMTFPKLYGWARRLKRGPIEVYDGLQQSRISMINAHSGEEINWAIQHLPSLSPKPAPLEGQYAVTAPPSTDRPLSLRGSAVELQVLASFTRSQAMPPRQ